VPQQGVYGDTQGLCQCEQLEVVDTTNPRFDFGDPGAVDVGAALDDARGQLLLRQWWLRSRAGLSNSLADNVLKFGFHEV